MAVIPIASEKVCGHDMLSSVASVKEMMRMESTGVSAVVNSSNLRGVSLSRANMVNLEGSECTDGKDVAFGS